jgi:hypothetical protein
VLEKSMYAITYLKLQGSLVIMGLLSVNSTKLLTENGYSTTRLIGNMKRNISQLFRNLIES